MSASAQLTRNVGPAWGQQFLAQVQRMAPRWLWRFAVKVGAWGAVARLPEQRRHSRNFLTVALNRPAGLTDVWRHFFAFAELVMLRLRICDEGPRGPLPVIEHEEAFETLIRSGEPALFGTFHFGHSDLLGFMLSTRGRRVAMVRLRLENSPDMDRLAERFGDAVSFIWANEPENLLFALKTALDAGNSLALQCDRSEFSAKTEAFEFLGARRIFPFTIYHLAILYGRPVMFCFGLPDGNDGTRVIANPLYQPHGATRDENFTRAREHFQGVLARLEALVRQHPYLWFNFHPLNAIAAPATAAVPETGAQNMGPRAPVANGTAQSAMPTSNAGTELER